MSDLRVPRVIGYDAETKTLRMEAVTGMSLADWFGEAFEAVPGRHIDSARRFVRFLADNGVEHPDITGYNFMVDDGGNFYAIDFEHACFMASIDSLDDDFVRLFIDGIDSWNTRFN